MRLQTTRIASAVVAGAALALLAGCFSGDDDDAPTAAAPDAEVPASAAASPAALVGYLDALAKTETDEPLNVDAFVPPTSETAEPDSVT